MERILWFIIIIYAVNLTQCNNGNVRKKWKEIQTTVGKFVRLSCGIEFETMSTTEWKSYKNGSESNQVIVASLMSTGTQMPGKTYIGRAEFQDNDLLLKDLNLNDTAIYYCASVLKDDRRIIGNVFSLKVAEIRFHKANARVGASMTLPCVTAHETFKILYWYKNDTKEPVAIKQGVYVDVADNYKGRIEFDDKNMILKNSRVSDTGFYQCKTVKNQETLDGNRIIKLLVSEPPKCLDFSTSKLALPGASTWLRCNLQGEAVKIQWKKIGEPDLDLSKRFSISKKGLYISNTSKSDAGKYQISLTNDVGSFSNIVELTVKSSVELENYEVANETEMAVIPCGKANFKDGGKFSWTKDSFNVVDRYKGRAKIGQNGSLIIYPTVKEDSGFYTCNAETKFNGATVFLNWKMFLNIKYLPVIENILSKKNAFVGSSAVLPCAVTGNPGVSFKWLLPNGQTIRSDDKYSIVMNGSLIIHNVGVADAKNYTCAPENELGEGERKQSELVILSPPEFLYPGKKETVIREGSNVTLDCASSGIPKPSIVWAHNDKKIQNQGRFKMGSIGTLAISSVNAKDAGMYDCVVKSVAGHKSRSIKLIVLGKPGAPLLPEASIKDGIVFSRWQASYNGGSKQHFEIWGRNASQNEFSWRFLKNIPRKSTGKTESKNFELTEIFDKFAKNVDVTFFFSVRAINERGASPFSEVVKVILLANSKDSLGGTRNKYIVDKPFPPFDVTVNVTKRGYFLSWKELVVPGRPAAEKIVIQYRKKGSAHQWRDLKSLPFRADKDQSQGRRRRRSTNPPGMQTLVEPKDLQGEDFLNLEFQIISVSVNGWPSIAEKPNVVVTATPDAPSKVPASNPDDENQIAPIVLGSIFGAFGILLILSIYCFCRKRKNQRYSAAKKEQIAFTKENGVRIDDVIEADYGEEHDDADDAKLLSSKEQDSPRRYHLQTCPALKLGEYSNNGNSGKSKDPVYFLLQRYEEEKEMCTCSNMRFMTLNSHEQRMKREKKRSQRSNGNGMYKSNSSPSLILTSENEGSSIDPSELLDEEGYDISDNEKDMVSELKTEQFPTLKRQTFKDSYDQFCRDESTRRSLSSEEKTEADKNVENVDLKDINDVSSENSATESERVITAKALSDKEDNRRSKSSGYGDGSNTTSDSESTHEGKAPSRVPPYTNGYMTDNMIYRRDHGYASDISTRSSPLDYKGNRNRYQPPSQRLQPRLGYDPLHHHYISEDDSIRSSHSGVRPIQPPPYNQALHDIERLSEKNDITDSEDMYDHLVDMGRQLGVSLDDSIESDLNTKGMMPPPPPIAFPNAKPYPPVESGYLTDTSIGKERYTDREKSERCAQLLSEFKSSKSRNTINNNTDNESYDNELPVEPASRCRSVMGNGTEFEEPRVPPVLRRSNSAGASGVYKEWLV